MRICQAYKLSLSYRMYRQSIVFFVDFSRRSWRSVTESRSSQTASRRCCINRS